MLNEVREIIHGIDDDIRMTGKDVKEGLYALLNYCEFEIEHMQNKMNLKLRLLEFKNREPDLDGPNE